MANMETKAGTILQLEDVGILPHGVNNAFEASGLQYRRLVRFAQAQVNLRRVSVKRKEAIFSPKKRQEKLKKPEPRMPLQV